LEKLAKEGTQRIDVICPGFVSDCLETLEEIGIEGKATFLGAGGKDYRLIPCLNEREDWIRAMCDIALANLDGWVSAHWDAPAIKREAEARRALALNAGAKH
jgi:protoporphyrin/coproporphyrin ferrochelatase